MFNNCDLDIDQNNRGYDFCHNREALLTIHGLSGAECQGVSRSVLDPMLVTSTGKPRRYSVELGRRMEQRLWETLTCPSFDGGGAVT